MGCPSSELDGLVSRIERGAGLLRRQTNILICPTFFYWLALPNIWTSVPPRRWKWGPQNRDAPRNSGELWFSVGFPQSPLMSCCCLGNDIGSKLIRYRIEIGLGKNCSDCSETQKLTFETQLLQWLTFKVIFCNPSPNNPSRDFADLNFAPLSCRSWGRQSEHFQSLRVLRVAPGSKTHFEQFECESTLDL